MSNPSIRIVTKRIKPDGSAFTVAAGSADVNSDVIDTAGYESVRIITGFGAITSGAVTSQKLQQGQASNMSDAADLAGSSQTVADTDDNKIVVSEIYRPQERYVRAVTKRATQNAVIDFMIVELFGARKIPITDDTTVLGGKKLVSPDEGTA